MNACPNPPLFLFQCLFCFGKYQLWKSSPASIGAHAASVTLPRTCLDWIDRKVESRVYANRSHAIEAIVLEAMKNERGVCQPRFELVGPVVE
jgi:hypothetical protein